MARWMGVVFGLLVACGDGGSIPLEDAATGLDASPDAEVFATAPHAAAPTVVKQAGPVLATPKVVVVTFDSDPLAAQIETFAQGLGASTYWKATTSEYGVGAVQFRGAVHTTAPSTAALSTTAFETWLGAELDGTHAEWPAPDGSTIYSVVMPPLAGIEVDGLAPCKSSPAYHYEITVAGAQVPYAAVNRCDGAFGLSGIDFVSAGLSHEWVEAATDPFYLTNPAYIAPSSKYNDWYVTTGGELADMCTLTTSVYFKPDDLPFTVQRSWSNAAASQGNDPCVPTSDPYFNAAPQMPDAITGTYYGQKITSEGVHVPLGGTVVVEVDLFSAADIGSWHVTASAASGAQLAFTWDRNSGQNGDKLALTIKRIADGTGMTGIAFFTLVSIQGTHHSAWVGAVGD